MTHLTSEQFVEALDGTLSPASARHLEQCDACGRDVAALGAVLSRVQSTAMPEPSPLFWEHLSRRVQAATSEIAMPGRRWWEEVFTPVSTMGLAMAALALVFVVRVPSPKPAGDVAPASVIASSETALDDTAAEPWDLLTNMAADLPAGDAQQIAQPSTDAAAGVLEQLSPAQRTRLLQLIKAEMDRGE